MGQTQDLVAERLPILVVEYKTKISSFKTAEEREAFWVNELKRIENDKTSYSGSEVFDPIIRKVLAYGKINM